jgi:large subunit ribosomal protein L25
MLTLTATKREETGKRAKRLLTSGILPATVYGPKQEAVSISIPEKAFEKVLKEAGESSVIELSGVTSAPLQVLIHEVDHDPITNTPRHADFYAIEKGAKVEVEVPLVFVGESPAVKLGANLVKVLHELKIEAAPADLPHDISVDTSVLVEIGSHILVKDLSIPSNVRVFDDPEQVVVLVQEVVIEEEAPVAEVDMTAIEVEKKGKEVEAAAEPAE